MQMLRDLVDHKGHANAAMLRAIGENAAASADPEVLELLEHILVANRFWLLSIRGEPFVLEEESRPAASFETLVEKYAASHTQECAWLDTATDSDLERVLASPLIPHGACSVRNAILQVCLHSHGHRAQCAKLLRRHGSTPPMTDFVLWVVDRPRPEWPN